MFMFNKSNAVSRSRQSSIDSLVTDPSTSASASDVWVSQSSEASSYGEMSSPERRERPHLGKRNSVFNLRSRSNTASSATPSFASLSSNMAGPEGLSKRTSQDLRSFTSQSLLDIAGSKRSIFARGKAGRRLSGHISPGSGMGECEEVDIRTKRTSVLRKVKRSVHQSESSIKHRISSPFDFQHLTHTDRHQFTALEAASENDLMAEFRAARVSQAPRRDLNGIKADDIHFNNFSSENLAAPDSRSPSALACNSPPQSPLRATAQPESPLQNAAVRSIRPSRSAESFSQPTVRPRSHRHTQSANPPPRVSSRTALTRIDDLPEEPSDDQSLPTPFQSRRQSGIWDKFAPMSSLPTAEKLSTIADEPDYVGHAFTTPDNSAIHPVTPPFSPDLENVPEEPERFVSPRPAPRPPVKSPKSPQAPFLESFSFRHNTRSPIKRSNSQSSGSHASPKSPTQRNPMTRPISQMSDTLGSHTLARRNSVRRAPMARSRSNTWRVFDDSWEDDIDYIYDNALEADCDFDWDRTSDDEAYGDRDRTPEQQDHERPSTALSRRTQSASNVSEDEATLQTRFFTGAFRPSLLVPSANQVPELESRSAVSASTADTGFQTPSDLFSLADHRHNPFVEPEGFTLTPSLLIPPEYKEQVSRDDMYDDLLADYEGSDRHFPLLDATQSVTSSSRSSHLRLSKRSSYDSTLMSSGLWNSPVRRSASSSGSLPELVHSRRVKRDLNVENLTEQVASFRAFADEDQDEEEEDDDTTPPGRPLQDRTFFAEENERQACDAIEGEVPASLELARRGSTTRSTRAPLHSHKYASSDGAAKLLAFPKPATSEPQPPPKSRHRAASSNNAIKGNRQPYLSLFPAPPKHMPTP